jgi:hypothetical protein
VTVVASPGQTFNGTQQMGNICVMALSNQLTQVVPLLLGSPTARKADGTLLTDLAAGSGRVIVISGQAYVEVVALGNSVQLNFFGPLGTTWMAETATTIGGPWTALSPVSFTSQPQQSLSWSNQGEPARFFRLRQQ